MLSLDRWIENFEGYLDARIELVKYDLKEALVNILTRSVSVLGIVFFGLAGLICFNFGLAYLIGYWIGNEFSGFFILTVFYFLIAFLFYLKRDSPALKENIENQLREALNHQPNLENEKDKNE